jgi:hypothetical protein
MDNYLPSSEAFSEALARYQPMSLRHAKILSSWREHPSKGDLWRALQTAAVKHGKAAPEPADFIGIVLGSTMPAQRLNDHNERVLNQVEKLKREISAVVSDADYPLNLWRDLEKFEERLRELDRSTYDMHGRLPAGGRKKGSRDSKLFAQRMFRYLQNACGRHLASEVTKMLDIVFSDVKHDGRTVRSWLPKAPKPVV